MSMKLHIVAVALLAGCARPGSVPFSVVERAQPQLLDLDATGITVDENGRRLLWASQRGLVTAAEPHELVMPILSSFAVEDVAAFPGNRVGVIGRGEGRVLDMTTGRAVSRFCYVPDSFGDSPVPTPVNPVPTRTQLSRSIAFGADEGRIYVQPQTFENDRPVDTQLGQFELGNDQPLEWQGMEELDGIAGGMVVTRQNRILLGLGDRLFEYDSSTQTWGRSFDLAGRLVSIEGLAIDRTTNTLLVLDGPGRRVLELDLP
ncbi:MAG: hypothetical protein JNM17_17605 [Archangium sp.]|nr:hypothetical protein [Archangium sp.]